MIVIIIITYDNIERMRRHFRFSLFRAYRLMCMGSALTQAEAAPIHAMSLSIFRMFLP